MDMDNPKIDPQLGATLTSLSERLTRLSVGDELSTDAMIAELYDELRSLARSHLNHLPPGNSLFATGLVHEAFLKLGGDLMWDSRGHFFGAAAQAMRQVLVDRTRRKMRIKRGGDRDREELGENIVLNLRVSNDELLALDEVLTEFEAEDPRRAMVVKMHFFAGLNMVEIASQLDVSHRTVKRDWQLARAALRMMLTSKGKSRPDLLDS